MPRPSKVFRRMKINAASAYKRGDRTEAYKLWGQAATGLKEMRDKKRNRRKIEAAEKEAAAKDAAAKDAEAEKSDTPSE